MSISEMMAIVKQVILNPYVIGTAIVVLLFMNFCSFVANYKKKPTVGKKKKSSAAPKAPAKPAEEAASAE